MKPPAASNVGGVARRKSRLKQPTIIIVYFLKKDRILECGLGLVMGLNKSHMRGVSEDASEDEVSGTEV